MPKLVQEVEAFFSKALVTFKAEVAADWAELEPALAAIGKTVEGDVLVAAQIFVSSGGNFVQALGSITSQIPAIESSVEAAIAGLLALKIAGLKASTAAPAAIPIAQPGAQVVSPVATPVVLSPSPAMNSGTN